MDKITDYIGCRVRINPTGFDVANTKFGRAHRMWADVTVLSDRGQTLDLGKLQVFNRSLVDQVKYRYVGRPIIGTLTTRTDPGRPGVRILRLVDIEEEEE